MQIFKTHQALEVITPHLPPQPIIVEAGAFDGTDTLRMIKQWPDATIYAFEPIPYRFAQLAQKTKDYPNIHCYPYALSNTCGIATLYVAENPLRPGKPGQASSLNAPHERLEHSPIIFPSTITVETITLDVWAKQHNISHIDLLWLDTQGHELPILQAAQTMLSQTKFIYTEVGFKENYKEQALYLEVLAYLETQGFTEIGRDFETTDNLLFGNIVTTNHRLI